MSALEPMVCFTNGAGDHTSLALTGDAHVDLAAAVEEDHYCEDEGCDIREARENGYAATAAQLLTGATEVYAIPAVLDAYTNAGRELSLHELAESEWEAWKGHFDHYGRECPSCGAFTFANDSYEPETCPNCGASLMRDYAIAVVYHFRSNREPDDAYEHFEESGAEALYQSNPHILTPEQAGDPDFHIDLFYANKLIEPEPAGGRESDPAESPDPGWMNP